MIQAPNLLWFKAVAISMHFVAQDKHISILWILTDYQRVSLTHMFSVYLGLF